MSCADPYNKEPNHADVFGKSATFRQSNHGSGVCKEHYAQYYVFC